MKYLITLCFLLVSYGQAFAAMHADPVNYKDGDVTLKGVLYWEDTYEGKRPGILVLHEKWGLNDYIKLRAEMLAELGYVAFAADLYGDGQKTRDIEEANKWMQTISSKETMARRAHLSLAELQLNEKVDPSKVAVLGYSLGGTAALELAYKGAKLKGLASFHGAIPIPSKYEAVNMLPKVLIAQGSSDDFANDSNHRKAQEVWTAAGVNWQMNIYGGGKNSFSNPYADGYDITGMAFHEDNDRKSWLSLLRFFEALFTEDDLLL